MIEATGQPLYLQVAADLRSQIASRKLAIGQEIPSTAKMADQYGVSIGVIRAAVKMLQEEGVLFGHSGKGVFVRASPGHSSAMKSADERIAELQEKLDQLTEQLPADVIAKIEELSTEVGELQANLRTLYARSGMEYPHSSKTPEKRRRKSSGA